jgi:thiamine-monophosphate kinase
MAIIAGGISVRNTPMEWSRIQRIKSLVQRQSPHTVVGLGDDAFVFKNFPGYSVLAQDMMVENIHFRREYCSATDLGHKALAVNLSDLAAMGAQGHFAQVSLALPKNLTQSWLDDFYKGMTSLADQWNIEVVGGDLTASEKSIVIDVSVFGSTEKVFTRKGAKPGDLLLSSGPLGLSHAGMLALQKNIPNITQALSKHRRPTPRLDLVAALHTHAHEVHALMDCSDGLINDALQLCGDDLGLHLKFYDSHFHPEVLAVAEELEIKPSEFLLWGGEDYELLLVIPKSAQNLFTDWQVLGQFQTEAGVFLEEYGGTKEITDFKGWAHF